MNCALLYWPNAGLSLHVLWLILYMYQWLADLLAFANEDIKSLVNMKNEK